MMIMSIRPRCYLAAAGLAAAFLATSSGLSGQSGMQRAIQQSRELALEFEVTQGSNCANPGSLDQITIVFSNQAAENLPPPPPALGDDVVAEFSFSARDFVKDRLLIRRRIRDRSILDARFIRVVNMNGDSWCPGQLSLTIDGRTLLKQVPMADRTGPASGLQDWNRNGWSKRTYWQKNLQTLLPATNKY
jgi:hypothetical protein